MCNDYQQFLAHFDWFLSLFQIFDVKNELLPVKLKVYKNGIFWAKNLFQKNFLGYFCTPIKVMWNWAKMASKWVFIGVGRFPPPLLKDMIPQKPYRSRVKSLRTCLEFLGDNLVASFMVINTPIYRWIWVNQFWTKPPFGQNWHHIHHSLKNLTITPRQKCEIYQ